MAWPSVVTTFTNPAPTDKLNSPSHSGIETSQNTDLTAIETFVGTEASTIGTLFYDVRAAGSNGGGHVQTVNKGGTGQTSYTKGNILVASSSSVLTKVAVGTDSQVLQADSSQAAGVGWIGVATAAQIQAMTYNYAQDSGTGSVYAIAPTPCVLSYAPGQMFLMKALTTNTIVSPALSVSSLVAKKIINFDKSSVMVGQIQSSTLGLYSYDGTQFETLTIAGSITYTSGIDTKNAADASTTQNIAHGLGKTPKKITIHGTVSQGSGNYFTDTIYNGTTQTSFSIYNSGGGATSASTFTLNNAASNSDTTGTVTFDATNIVIVWTKTNSPTGTYTLIWQAEG